MSVFIALQNVEKVVVKIDRKQPPPPPSPSKFPELTLISK